MALKRELSQQPACSAGVGVGGCRSVQVSSAVLSPLALPGGVLLRLQETLVYSLTASHFTPELALSRSLGDYFLTPPGPGQDNFLHPVPARIPDRRSSEGSLPFRGKVGVLPAP